jgi:hypothetical protein
MAQNMMYRHSVTADDASDLKLVKTIPDSVDLAKPGYPEYASARGAPVEAAFTWDGRYAYGDEGNRPSGAEQPWVVCGRLLTDSS